jgi:ubiquinone/menaquinone biosynthesis C-methylase UbiE
MSLHVPTADDYDEIYRRRRSVTILDKIAAQVVRDPTITKLNCTGFLGPGDRKRFRNLLKVAISAKRPATLVDLGCGTALLGPWLAERLGLDFVGVDISPVAIALASSAAPRRSTIRKKFVTTSFEATGLRANSVAAVFSLDALYLASHPAAALQEARRVMTPGAPLLFTYFVDSKTKHDWPQLVESTGFDIVSIADVTGNWRRYMCEKHQRRWKLRRKIATELGERAGAELSVSASMLGLGGRRSYIRSTFRYLLHAIKPTIRPPERRRSYPG